MHRRACIPGAGGYTAGAYGGYGRRLQATQATTEQPQASAEEACLRNGISSTAYNNLVRGYMLKCSCLTSPGTLHFHPDYCNWPVEICSCTFLR